MDLLPAAPLPHGTHSTSFHSTGGHMPKKKEDQSAQNRNSKWPPPVENSIAVEHALENRGLYRALVLRFSWKGLRHYGNARFTTAS